MKMNKSKFNVKTTDKEIIEVEGRLIMVNDQSKLSTKTSSKAKQPTLKDLSKSFVDFKQEISNFVQEMNTFVKDMNTFVKDMNTFVQDMSKFVQEMNKFVYEQRAFNNIVNNRLDNIEQDIKLMKNTSTMKRELQNS